MRTVIVPLLWIFFFGASSSPAFGTVEENQGAVLEHRKVQRQIVARSGAFISLRNLMGTLEVEGWDRDEVAVEGLLGTGVEDLRLESDGQRVWLEVLLKGAPEKQYGKAELRVRVPSRCQLEVRTVEAPVVLKGLRGRLNFESVTGDLRVLGGSPEEIIVSTVSGNLVFSAPTLQLQARTVGGSVRIEEEIEDLTVRTGSGSVDLLARVVREARLESVSGHIHVTAEMADEARLQVFVHDGLAELTLPSNLVAKFHLETARGSLESDFGPPLPVQPAAARQVVSFDTGPGQARVEARSISGTLRLIAQPF